MPLINQCADHIDHAPDLFRCLRMNRGRLYIKCLHIFPAFRNITLGNHGRIHPFLIRFPDDLIIYVRKVGDVIHRIAFVLHITSGRVKNDHRTCITDMDQVIDSGPAHVHAHLPLLQRYEFLFLPGQCVINFHLLCSSCILSLLLFLPYLSLSSGL